MANGGGQILYVIFCKKIIILTCRVRKIPIVEYEESSLELDSAASNSCPAWRPETADPIWRLETVDPIWRSEGVDQTSLHTTDRSSEAKQKDTGSLTKNAPTSEDDKLDDPRARRYIVADSHQKSADLNNVEDNDEANMAQNIDDMFSPIFDTYPVEEEETKEEEKKEEGKKKKEENKMEKDKKKEEEKKGARELNADCLAKKEEGKDNPAFEE